ncbi:MAG: sigma factor-like helix-turn-helix DNA-binding protein [Actinomycetota bacterium]
MVASFEDFYVELHPRLIAALAATCGDLDLARDAADEAAARALERWDRVEAMANPQGWVYRVAINQVRRKARRRDLERRVLRREHPPEPVPGPAGEVWHLVEGLSRRQREAVVLRHVLMLREPEIGRVMGVTRGTVSSTLRAAYARLRSDLEDHEEMSDAPRR